MSAIHSSIRLCLPSEFNNYNPYSCPSLTWPLVIWGLLYSWKNIWLKPGYVLASSTQLKLYVKNGLHKHLKCHHETSKLEKEWIPYNQHKEGRREKAWNWTDFSIKLNLFFHKFKLFSENKAHFNKTIHFAL